jgi:hypothetical protein
MTTSLPEELVKEIEKEADEYAYGRDLLPTLDEELITPKLKQPTADSLRERRAYFNGATHFSKKLLEQFEALNKKLREYEYEHESETIQEMKLALKAERAYSGKLREALEFYARVGRKRAREALSIERPK